MLTQSGMLRPLENMNQRHALLLGRTRRGIPPTFEIATQVPCQKKTVGIRRIWQEFRKITEAFRYINRFT